MKTRMILFGIFVLLFTLGACSNKAYDEAMLNGDQAIEDKEYELAITYFEAAMEAKKKDEFAPRKLKQTEVFIEALELVEIGELSEAKSLFMEILDSEAEDKFLHDDASEQILMIEDLEETYATIENKMEEIEKLIDEEDFDMAIAEIEVLKEIDFSHVFLQTLQGDLIALEEDVTSKQQLEEERVQMERALSEVKILGKEKKYDEAIKLIDKTLEEEISDSIKEEFTHDFEGLSTEYHDILVAEQKKKEEQEKSAKALNSMYGYYQLKEFPNDFIYIHPTYFVNYVYESDVGFAVEVSKYEIDSDKKMLQITSANSGGVFGYNYGDTTLHAPQGTYHKISESGVEGSYPMADLNDFKKENIPDWMWGI